MITEKQIKKALHDAFESGKPECMVVDGELVFPKPKIYNLRAEMRRYLKKKQEKCLRPGVTNA